MRDERGEEGRACVAWERDEGRVKSWHVPVVAFFDPHCDSAHFSTPWTGHVARGGRPGRSLVADATPGRDFRCSVLQHARLRPAFHFQLKFNQLWFWFDFFLWFVEVNLILSWNRMIFQWNDENEMEINEKIDWYYYVTFVLVLGFWFQFGRCVNGFDELLVSIEAGWGLFEGFLFIFGLVSVRLDMPNWLSLALRYR